MTVNEILEILQTIALFLCRFSMARCCLRSPPDFLPVQAVSLRNASQHLVAKLMNTTSVFWEDEMIGPLNGALNRFSYGVEKTGQGILNVSQMAMAFCCAAPSTV